MNRFSSLFARIRSWSVQAIWARTRTQPTSNWREDYESTLAAWRASADRGDAEAQFTLGLLYGELGATQDDAEAVRWYRKAADQGHAFAQHNLGCMYLAGRGVTQDDVLAAQWERKSADQGLPSAQQGLGTLYFQGRGVPQNYQEAARWYRQAAKRRNAQALHGLGLLYAQGLGQPRDHRKAHRLMARAVASYPLEDAEDRARAVKDRDQAALLVTADWGLQARQRAGDGRRNPVVRLLGAYLGACVLSGLVCGVFLLPPWSPAPVVACLAAFQIWRWRVIFGTVVQQRRLRGLGALAGLVTYILLLGGITAGIGYFVAWTFRV